MHGPYVVFPRATALPRGLMVLWSNAAHFLCSRFLGEGRKKEKCACLGEGSNDGEQGRHRKERPIYPGILASQGLSEKEIKESKL